MRDYRARKLQLARMELRRLENRELLREIDRQMRDEAERVTLKARPKVRAYGRGRHTWTGADERYYQSVLARLEEQRANEIGGLKRKIARQTEAIMSERRRLGINEPAEREYM